MFFKDEALCHLSGYIVKTAEYGVLKIDMLCIHLVSDNEGGTWAEGV